MVIAVLASCLFPTQAKARRWENVRGLTTEAEFVSYENNTVYLRRHGKVIAIPYTELSLADRQYVASVAGKGKQKLTRFVNDRPKLRVWKNEAGKTLSGAFARIDPGAVIVIKAGTREFKVPFLKLAFEDQEYIRSRLGEKQDDLLPPVQMGSRVWTNSEGKRLRAVLVKSEFGTVTLRVGEKTHKVPLGSLSRADQNYVQRMKNKKPVGSVNKPAAGSVVGATPAQSPKAGGSEGAPADVDPAQFLFGLTGDESLESEHKAVEPAADSAPAGSDSNSGFGTGR